MLKKSDNKPSLNKHLLEVCEAFKINPADGLTIHMASNLAQKHHPSFTPNQRLLISGIGDMGQGKELVDMLDQYYPSAFIVQGLKVIGNEIGHPVNICVSELANEIVQGKIDYLHVPPLGENTSFESFQEVVARLRAPDGCPWDREQTHLSLRPHLMEEAYEVLDAMDRSDSMALCEELGDLLLQIVLNAQIAHENGEFRMTDVLEGINSKIIRRHPHVFGELSVGGVDGVLKNWEKLKEIERAQNGEGDKKGLLDGVPKAIPALTQAQEYQDRAARVGFDWAEIEPVIAKVREELDEVLQAPDEEQRTGELGDLLFAVVNLARWYKVDAESMLRQTNARFARRFKHIEARSAEQGRKLTEMTLEEMDRFWEEAKDRFE